MNRFKIEENESETVLNTAPVELKPFSEPVISENIIPEDKFKVIELPPVNQIETFENEKEEINQNYVLPNEEEKEEELEEPPHKFFGNKRGSQKNRNLQPTAIVEYEQKKKPNIGLILLGGGLLATIAANFI